MRAGTLAPADLGDIISDAVSLCVRRAASVLPMALITVAGTEIMAMATEPLTSDLLKVSNAGGSLHAIPWRLAALLPLGSAVVLFNQLAYERLAFDAWTGNDGHALNAYLAAARRYVPALLAAFATVLACALASWTLVGIPIAIYFAVCWNFAGQVCVIEGETNPLLALRRSRAIVLGSWWRTAAILLAILLLSLLPSFLADWLSVGRDSAALVLGAVATAIAAPFLATAQTRLYVDLRLRKHEPITLAPGGPAKPV
jgi:hypothetical protein